MALSFDQTRELVRNAICAPLGKDQYAYVCELYPDSVIYEQGNDLYRRTYAIVDGTVTLGDAVKVERQVNYVPLQAACRIMAAVEGDETGTKWRVCVVKFGADKNGVYWDKDALTAAIGKFDGAKVFALQDAQHAKPGSRPMGKSPREIIGALTAAAIENDGIYADLVVLPSASWLSSDLTACTANGIDYVYGLSVDIACTKVRKMVAGKPLVAPGVVRGVQVDVVYDPAAGGGFLERLAAAVETGQKGDEMFEKLLAALKVKRPSLYTEINDGLTAGTLTEDQAVERITAALVIDAGGSKATSNAEFITAAVVSGLRDLLAPSGEAPSAELQEMKLIACSMTLDRELTNSKLPEAAQDNLRAAYADKVFEVTDLQASIKSTKEMLDKLQASGSVEGAGGVRIVLDSLDKAGTYLDDFFAGDKGVHSFKACYRDITGDQRITGELRDATNLRAAISTTTFDQILGDSLTRRMVAEYNLAGLDDWKKIATVVPLSDFRTQRRPRMGGYGNLPAVAQSGAYGALTSPADEEATYAPSKRGGTESITLEAIRNDDVGAIRRIPIKLGRSAARTLYVFVFDFFATNPTLYDTVAFFHATHVNLGTAALSKATLQAGRLMIMKQTEAGSSEVLGIPPRYLLVPPDLEDTAFELTTVPAAGLFTPTAPDAVRRQTYETICVKTWTDTNNWYLTCDPNDVPGIEIGFLDGKQEPELFTQDLPNVGSMFSNDQLIYKIRHIYGGAVTDYRGSQGNVVA